ncbi:MAG: hypothetical protein LQ337_007286 [Flavoplaca oasis]|nr:MAG: hypothetical protein LQ337_007286 [Flavoplaca oasis]
MEGGPTQPSGGTSEVPRQENEVDMLHHRTTNDENQGDIHEPVTDEGIPDADNNNDHSTKVPTTDNPSNQTNGNYTRPLISNGIHESANDEDKSDVNNNDNDSRNVPTRANPSNQTNGHYARPPRINGLGAIHESEDGTDMNNNDDNSTNAPTRANPPNQTNGHYARPLGYDGSVYLVWMHGHCRGPTSLGASASKTFLVNTHLVVADTQETANRSLQDFKAHKSFYEGYRVVQDELDWDGNARCLLVGCPGVVSILEVEVVKVNRIS